MKKWYVVQTTANGEDYFRRDLLMLIQESSLVDRLTEVLVPTRKKSPEDLDGEKIFPGYVLICADMDGELASFISKVPRFSKFVGGVPPVALQDKEVEGIFQNAHKLLKGADPSILIGGEVKIVDGPFSSFVGTVEGVEADGQKVRLSVSIFGRMTSIVVDRKQIEE